MELKTLSITKTCLGLFKRNEITDSDLNSFTNALKTYYQKISLSKGKETEDHYKALFRDFLLKAFYVNKNYINTFSFFGLHEVDLVIHSSDDHKSRIEVIIETKNPGNITEMISKQTLNRKALHEAVLYYLQERMVNDNIEMKRIVITNFFDFYFFDAKQFHDLFYKNATIRNVFSAWSEHKTDDDSTKQMYNIIKKEINGIDRNIEVLHFNINDFTEFGTKANISNIKQLYQIFSPRYLLKETPKQDSNQLNKEFYNELLHILGLEEYKEKNKKLIRPKMESDVGSLLENTIRQLKTHHITNPDKYGDNTEKQLFNFGLQLCITWMNRILFLKLLEAQLISYHNGDENYAFLDFRKIETYKRLTELFFHVLAIPENDRVDVIKQKFNNLPYLNSSLFDRTEQEEVMGMAELSSIEIPVYSKTVLKKEKRRLSGSLDTLEYLLRFLDAYDFGAETETKDAQKTLINASVLGLIFEKINGYKEGSYYTPGYITMYMCRETIRRSVIDKVNEEYERFFDSFDELKNYFSDCYKPEELQRINNVINSITICDPAVGSGHFLVSALNEIIFIKAELGILCDINGKSLKSWNIEVVNDELFVHDPYSVPFEYKLNEDGKPHRELQNIQETLFREKQTIIENCLFGVDINPNSVNICRLRLWIELLKNAYYTRESNYKELQTLPNIDINIKCGNSLISRFEMDTNLTKILPLAHITMDDYLEKVNKYKNATSKNEKQNLRETIKSIKNTFQHELEHTTLVYEKYKKARNVYNRLLNNFDVPVLLDEKMKKRNETKLEDAEKKFNKAQAEWEAWKDAEIYHDAFEWRFEFPEVLDHEGKFNGFGVVIGNPPYITLALGKGKINTKIHEKEYYKNSYKKVFEYKGNTFSLFLFKSLMLVHNKGYSTQIIPNTVLLQKTYSKIRKYILQNYSIIEIVNLKYRVFQDAEIGGNTVFVICNSYDSNKNVTLIEALHEKDLILMKFKNYIKQNLYKKKPFFKFYTNIREYSVFNKLSNYDSILDTYVDFYNGIKTGNNKRFLAKSKESKLHEPVLKGKDIKQFTIEYDGNYVLYDPKLLWSNTNREFFNKSPKIIIRQTGDKLISSLDYKNFLTMDTTHILFNFKINEKFILGLINSKLLTWFYNYLTDEQGRAFAEVKIAYLKFLPIYPHENKQIIKIVDNIHIFIEKDNKDKVINLQSELDLVVYKLYNLMYNEVLIVDPEFEKQMSQEEYEKYEIDKDN